jgi:hypothetical protein
MGDCPASHVWLAEGSRVSRREKPHVRSCRQMLRSWPVFRLLWLLFNHLQFRLGYPKGCHHTSWKIPVAKPWKFRRENHRVEWMEIRASHGWLPEGRCWYLLISGHWVLECPKLGRTRIHEDQLPGFWWCTTSSLTKSKLVDPIRKEAKKLWDAEGHEGLCSFPSPWYILDTYIILYYITLYYIILYLSYIILHYIILYYTIIYYIILYNIIL